MRFECIIMEHESIYYRRVTTYSQQAKQTSAQKMSYSMTSAERVLWSRLRANRLQNLHFRRQVAMHGFIADFYCHRARLIVEVDGPIHDKQEEYDDERDQILASNGITILRLTNDEVLSNLRTSMLKILTAAGLR